MNLSSAKLSGSPNLSVSAHEPGGTTLTFAGFRLEPDGTLFRGDTPIHLPPKELDALRLLLDNAGHIVTPQQMREALWGEVHVSADSVTKCVSSLRSRLEIEGSIQTVYKRGYRFTAPVQKEGSPSTAPMTRLAISPFVIGPGVPEYLGALLAEEVSAGFTRSRHPSVRVLAHDSVSTLARRGLMAQEIGEKLNADFVLAGNLRALPSHFRLGAEMIRVKDGVQVWAEDVLVDRNITAGLETELAARLNFRLRAGLPSERSHAADLETGGISLAAAADDWEEDSPRRREAHEIFQIARFEWRSLQRHRMQDGLQHLLRAIELDPALTEARIDLANLCVAQTLYGFMAPDAAAKYVRHAAEPLAGPAAASMLPTLGWISFHFDRNLADALRAFSLSAHLPYDPWIMRARSMFALSRHRFSETIAMLRAAIELDPFSAPLHSRLAWALHLAGKANESLEHAHRALEQFPEHAGASFYGALILAFNGETGQAVHLAEALEQRMPYLDLATAARAYALARDGQTKEAREVLEQLEWRGRERFTLSGFTPAAYLELGEVETALDLLRVSMHARCPWFFQMLADPRLKSLHGRPEFAQMQSVLARMEAEAARSRVPLL